jgi:hypothetical protein
MRVLLDHEVMSVAGGKATVTFEDNDRNGKLTAGDKVLYYTLDGIDMSPKMYEALKFDSGLTFSDVGKALDYAFSNPWETLGFFLDNMGEFTNGAQVNGGEYIDWKVGGGGGYTYEPPGSDATINPN